jgi:acetyl-CoA acetyltransferase
VRRRTAQALTREDQHALSAISHQRAAAATEADILAEEIRPVSVPQRKGDPLPASADEGIRAETTIESLSRLRPTFTKDGTGAGSVDLSLLERNVRTLPCILVANKEVNCVARLCRATSG